MAADWSQLPKDLLQLIYKKLNNQFYQLRFRSVCSPWRSSVPKNHHHYYLNNLPSKLPSSSSNSNNTSRKLPLSKRSIFLITPPPNQQTLNPWLIKIGPDSHDQTHLWHPLSRDTQFPLHYPIIDFNQLSVRDLGDEFVIGNFPSRRPLYISRSNSLYMRKVVVCDTWHNGIDHCSLLLTIHVTGGLAIFRSGDERWTLIPSISEYPYSDVCVFNGRPMAMDISGQIVEVRPDLSLDLVMERGFGAERKFLVESDGELLLVIGHLFHGCHDSVLDADGEGIYEGVVQFDVLRLDEKEKKWLHVKNLGNRVLFWGEDCAFSASFIGNGNCVIFSDDVFRRAGFTEFGISVYHLDQRRASPLSDFPCYSNLFWPAPEWVELLTDNNRVCVLD